MTEGIFDEAAVAAAWDANAPHWAGDVRAGFDLYRDLYTFPAFLSFMPRVAGRRVIDLGCGEGANTRRFARLGAHATAIDISEAMIGLAREAEAREPLGIAYRVCSYTDIEGIADGAMDCALSTMALMDGPDFDKAMRESARILTPGGTLCFSILHPCFATSAAKWLQASDGSYDGLRIGNYFDKASYVESWKFGKQPRPETAPTFRIPRFPRTLSDYVNAIVGAGFRILKIDEPRPDAGLLADHPWLARWHQHAPLVLFVMAAKG